MSSAEEILPPHLLEFISGLCRTCPKHARDHERASVTDRDSCDKRVTRSTVISPRSFLTRSSPSRSRNSALVLQPRLPARMLDTTHSTR